MAKKRNNSGLSSEILLALLILLILVALVGYYIYNEEVVVKRSYPKPPAVENQKEKTTLDIQYLLSDFEKMLPRFEGDTQIISHLGFTLSYNERAEQPSWVFYKLTSEYAQGKEKRSDSFKKDPKVKTESAGNDDYFRSGYDKGHLVPAADMRWNKRTMQESFYLSNISPQRPEFNRGIWKTLEDQVRQWALAENELYVAVGAILHDSLPVIGKNKVAVPEYFYKIILDISVPEFNGIGFIMKNEGSNEPLGEFAVSVDSVEALTGIDFFPALPDEMEDSVEGSLQKQNWRFSYELNR